MAAQQSQGIQTLLDAEKEAEQIVSKAREYRQQRLKDARGEAAKEVDALKAKRELEFKDYEKEHLGSQDSEQKTIDEDTEKKIESIKAQFKKNQDAVVKKLLDRVVDVDPQLHRNLVDASKSDNEE